VEIGSPGLAVASAGPAPYLGSFNLWLPGGDRERRGGAMRTGEVFSIASDARLSAAIER